MEELSIVLYSVEYCSCHADLKNATGGSEQKINNSAEVLEFVKLTHFACIIMSSINSVTQGQ